MMDTRIIIFAKAPVPGRVKTRLAPALGEDGAAALARTMLLHTIKEASLAGVGKPEICADPDPPHPDWQGLLPAGFRTSTQGEGDLGERLARAVQRALREDAAVLLIGTDCPALDRFRLCRAAADLRDHDAIIHPAADGGYVALGLRRYDASLFSGIAWSTSSVAKQTIERIRRLDWTLRIRETLRDVDVPEDLKAEGLAP
ncbi:MAG: glycosyltransferase [Sphingomonas sp.]|nr:glycosyltransferase [Sphingomonas sp.]